MNDAPLAGVDVDCLRAWLKTALPELPHLDEVSILAGGHSNLSFRLRLGDQSLVLRRPPLGHVMATAHDMGREFRIQSALAPTPVPVPRMLRYEADTAGNAGIGAPFYVMEFVQGQTLQSVRDNAGHAATSLNEVSFDVTRCLADLHNVDPTSVPLPTRANPATFLERQLIRWQRQLNSSRSRDTQRLDHLLERLGTPPRTTDVAIVHGDFKLNNAIVHLDRSPARIAAIIDWELSTIGDAMADLAVFGLYWQMATISPLLAEAFESPVHPDAGYPSFDELVAHYCALRKIAQPELKWHLAFAAFKIAVLAESLYFRHQSGLTVGDGFARIGDLTEELARFGLETLDGPRFDL